MKHFQFLVLLLCLSSAPVFSQDIIINNYSGGTTVGQYEEFQPTITVQNTGIVAINTYFYAAMYLSSNAVWDASDIPVGSVTFPASLGASQSSTATSENQVINTAPGTYYLIIKADHNGRVTETNESNNILVVPNFIITPSDVDFMFTSFATDKTSYTSNSLLKYSYVLKNLGSTDTDGSVMIRLALSTDNVLDPNDFYFYDINQKLTGPDVFTSTTHLSSRILPSIEAGNYYILAKVDSDMFGKENFAETNEVNNVSIVPISVTASTGVDFVINYASIFSVDYYGWNATVGLSNIGTTGSGGYKIAAQLITQGSTPDPYGYQEPFFIYDNYLDAGESKFHSCQFNTSLPAGTYYAAYNINYDQGVYENEYSNNLFIDYSNPIVIPPPPVYSVTFNSLTIPNIVDDSDQQINLNLNLTNSGNTKGYNQKYSVVVKDSSNATVHTQQTLLAINFNPGVTADKTLSLNLTNPMKTGKYTVLVTCLSPIYTSPTSNSTTLTVTPTVYTLTGTVKGEDGTLLTNGNLFLYQSVGSEVKFIQKISPYTGPAFSFSIDNNPHTLYFVPDPVVHPDYVPTIYGKTMVLQAESFFTASTNLNLDVEVLKTTQVAVGTGVINGLVTLAEETSTEGNQLSQSRVSTLSVPSFPVVLMSATQQPLQISYTDASGFYEFKNLPREVYEILICFGLDSIRINPVSVDITDKNMVVNFEINSDKVTATTSQLYLPQALTLNDFPSYQYGNAPVELNSQSNTSQPIEYLSSDSDIAAIVNNEIQIKGVGTVVITAQQVGNEFFLPASISRPMTISKADQSIILDFAQPLTYGDAPVILKGISSSALDVSYESSDPTIAAVEGNLLTLIKPGKVKITANQNGNELYNPATPVSGEVTIHRINQSLTFATLTGKTFGDVPFQLEGSSSAGLEVAFVSSDASIASINGILVTIHSAGSVQITAEQSGNEFFNPALSAHQILTIEKASQTISFDALTDVSADIGSFELLSSATSKLKTFFKSSDEEVVSIEGNIASVHKAGVVLITTEQPGDQNYYPAEPVSREVTIHKANQSLTVASLTGKTFGDLPFLLEGSSSSGLEVAFVSSDPSIASINGNLVTIHSAGSVQITAEQSGNEFFIPALSAHQMLTIGKATQIISFDALTDVSADIGSFELLSSATSNLETLFKSSDEEVVSIEGNIASVHKVGVVSITTEQPGDQNYKAATPVSREVTIQKANQSLTITALPRKTFGDVPFLLEGSSSSGLEVAFVSSNPSIASVDGNLVTIHSAGSVQITAEQSGNEFFNPAVSAYQILTIEKASQTISFDILTEVSADIGSFELLSSATSNLETLFKSSDEEVVSIEGNIASVHKAGVVLITTHQPGDQNYYPTEEVTRELRINIVLGIDGEIERRIYPNPTLGIVFLNIPHSSKVKVTDLTGREYHDFVYDESKVDLTRLKSGMYLIHLISSNHTSTLRVVKL